MAFSFSKALGTGEQRSLSTLVAPGTGGLEQKVLAGLASPQTDQTPAQVSFNESKRSDPPTPDAESSARIACAHVSASERSPFCRATLRASSRAAPRSRPALPP